MNSHGADVSAETLREGGELFRVVFEEGGLGIATSNLTDGRFSRANAAFCEMLGYTEAELQQRSFADITHPDHLAVDREAVRQLREGLIQKHVAEKRYVKKNGETLWGLRTLTRVRSADGKAFFALAMIADISAHKRAHAELRKSEVLLRSITDNSKDVIFVKDREGRFVFVNPACCRFNGKQAEQLLGHSKADFCPHAEEVAQFMADDRRVMDAGRMETFEEELIAADGSKHVFLTTKGPRFDGHGQVIGLIGIAHDITERVQMENALRESEASLRAFFDSPGLMRGVVEVLEDDILHLHDNVVSAQFFGRTVEEMRNQRASALGVPPATIRIWLQYYAESRQTGQPLNFDYAHEQGGVRRQFRVYVSYLGPGVSGPRHAYVIEDVTAQKQTLELQLRLATAVEQAAEMIVITDAQGIISYVNPAFENITGYSRAEVYGQTPRLLKSGRHTPQFYEQMWATLTEGEVWHGHLTNKRKDGTLFEEDDTISPIRDATGRIGNFVAVKRDVTHELALEEQHRQAAKLEAVGLLAGGVAHDFNNQLQVILGNIDMILQALPPDAPLRADIHEIQAAARHSADLTHQLLAFSRKQMILPRTLDLNESITSSLKMLVRLVGENIQLDFVPRPFLGKVNMDPAQLEQILVNLVANARDALPNSGRISIAVFNQTLYETDCQDVPDFVPPGDYVILTVGDNGQGMPPEVLEHLFEPFFTTKAIGQGTGLGLATVYGIVKQNRGAIRAESTLQKGTTFTIYLPRTQATVLPDAEPSMQTNPTGTETILVVEDEATVLVQVEKALRKLGYNVLTETQPALALKTCMVSTEPIHLLLTDVIMPGMNGKELAHRMQALRPDLRVLFMSGYTAEIMEQQGQLPADLAILQKPFNTASLAQHIRAALDAPTTQPQP